jgi:superoxide dismutase, Cu-Zn family
MKGVAVFDMGGVKGETTIEDVTGGLQLRSFFTELPSGQHGFHIHTNGDLRGEGCMGACSHFHKGTPCAHGGAPGSKGPRHTGDLGNIDKINHTYSYKLVGVKVDELLGRTLIIHADPDDLGQGTETDSKTTGHSGKRISCAIFGRAKDCETPRQTRKKRR